MSDAADPLKDSCQYAVDLVKQFLTLSAAGIAFVVGLVFAEKPGKLTPLSVGWSLTLFGLSILFGWLCYMRVVGKINKDKSYDVFEGFMQLTSALQILLFCGGVLILFWPTVHTARLQERPSATSTKPTGG
jgi:cytochrome bd-type quinol oxidase subunit 2